MDIISKNACLSGKIRIPGSKSHTIRSLILASFAEGKSCIKNPLSGSDCISAANAITLFGAGVDTSRNDCWLVEGAGKNMHLPNDVINTGNSGSLLYFLPPIAALFDGWSIFTGDESIRKRPVDHAADAIVQLGAQAFTSSPCKNTPPLIVRGRISSGKTIKTDGSLSQYISGIMMAASMIDGKTDIVLSAPKELPFLDMTRFWLKNLNKDVIFSKDYKHITIYGNSAPVKSFCRTIPGDWEAAIFPIIAALISKSKITIENVDNTEIQGDKAAVDVLKSLGGKIDWNSDSSLTAEGSILSAKNFCNNEFFVNLSSFPDALCALCAAACFTEGTLIFEDIGICRKKETDRIEVMQNELKKLGADIESGKDWMAVHGHTPFFEDGSKNPAFCLHGGIVDSFGDHRVCMALACAGVGLPEGEKIIIKNAECASVSFPDFFDSMNALGAGFKQD